MLADEEKTTFFLSFGLKFSKKVQDYGPLSMSGCITLEAKGEIKEELQGEIETALNRTLQTWAIGSNCAMVQCVQKS